MSIAMWILAAASFVYVVGLLWAWWLSNYFIDGVLWPLHVLVVWMTEEEPPPLPESAKHFTEPPQVLLPQQAAERNHFRAYYTMKAFEALTPAQQRYCIQFYTGGLGMVSQGYTEPHPNQAAACWAIQELDAAIVAAEKAVL